MAIVAYIPEHVQSPAAMKAVIKYCCQEKKVYDKSSDRRLVSGVNCDGENAYKEFMVTKRAYHKTQGMYFYQYTQSFHVKEDITPELAHNIALEFAEKAWKGYEVMVATHCDRNHIHSHFIINSVSYETGSKLRQNPNSLVELRALSDEICREHNLTTLKKYERNKKGISAGEYRAAVNGNSWKFKLMADIETAMEYSGSKQDFIENMSSLGYYMTWTPQRKYITFLCPNGKKCRDIKLHEEKFLKENIENELQIRETKYNGITKTEEQKIAERNRDVARRNEDNYNTDSGQRGGNGAAQIGGELPTGAVQIDFGNSNQKGISGIAESDYRNDGRNDDGLQKAITSGRLENRGSMSSSDSSYGEGLSGRNGKIISELQGADAENQGRSFLENGADGEEYNINTIENGGKYQTGWEESRELYEQHLEERERTRAGYSSPDEESWEAYSRKVDSDFAPVLDGIDTLASSVSKIIDDSSENEEERRKRIQAEENAKAIGTVLGTAIGLTAEALSSFKAKKEQQTEAEQQQKYEQPQYSDEEYYDEDYYEDEDIGFGLSM